ncbi:gp89 [Mycobacterium phage Barnyard]|uniref:Uncharacterized protein n=1 Tax=Mycobacterium phage Barnyard TaxID=205880 RepID=Q855Y3_9CAUD|nr:gp89 [Mycobacterium phage Barnyard]AAN02143.1 hypothetical protein PBI_BARNYARD_89 [Mycobacterium phage Barnyard]
MSNDDAVYAKIRGMEQVPLMTLTVNSESELGQAVMAVIFNKEGGWVRKNTDPLPEIYVELAGKRYRFRFDANTQILMDHDVFTFEVHAYGGIPSDDDQ